MKIRNEREYFAATFQSIFNWNDIRIGIRRAAKPNDLGDKRLCTNLTDVSSTENHSKYSIELNLWDICACNDRVQTQTLCCRNEHRAAGEKTRRRTFPQQQQQQQQQRRRRRTQPTTFLMYYLLYKLTQLCLIIVLLLPFLMTYNAFIQEAYGQVIAVPKSVSMPIINSNIYTNIKLNTNLNTNRNTDLNSITKLDNGHNRLNYSRADAQSNIVQFQESVSHVACHKPWHIHSKRHNVTNKYIDNDGNSTKHSINSGLPTHTYSQRQNGYSLIILSQSANHSYSAQANRSETSSNTQTQHTSTPKSAVIGNADGFSSRPKRHIDNANKTKSLQYATKRNSNTFGQILRPDVDQSKDRNSMNKKMISKEKLAKLVMTGLGLKKLPDMKKANISQLEYSSKYKEYLERIKKKQQQYEDQLDFIELPQNNLEIFSIETNSLSDITKMRWRHKRAARIMETQERKTKKKNSRLATGDRTNILLHFPLAINDAQFHYEKINEANVRLMMLYSPALASHSPRRAKSKESGNRRKSNAAKNKKLCNDYGDCLIPSKQPQYNRQANTRTHILNLKVFQLLPKNKRHLLDARKIEFESTSYGGSNEETRSQWLEFDVTEAVRSWLNKSHVNLGIEIQCDKCRRIGARILSDVATTQTSLMEQNDGDDMHERFHLTPVLNIIGHIGNTHREKAMHHPFNLPQNQSNEFAYHRVSHGYDSDSVKNWPNSCHKAHQRCCRHQLEVAFKDIKGFEFIIHPKVFDAGYCKGRCPPRHNPAHHHALLQSLIWQQDHSRVPRPCCAPSKLTELEILHVDEEQSDKLKISIWNDMQVLECACS